MNVTQEKIESRALRASAWGYLFMALLGGLFFYLAQSQAYCSMAFTPSSRC